MSGAEDETNTVVHDNQNSGSLGDWRLPAVAHRDEALRQLREDPGAVARTGVALEGELQRRRALFGGASEGAPPR